jgi:hypothetical protein
VGLLWGCCEGKFVTLADGRTTAELVNVLVSAGITVEGVWHNEQTLEDFYLDLVKPPALSAQN